jgi:class 3 adenylate cyclase
MNQIEKTVRHLKTEIKALEYRLGERNLLVGALRKQLKAMQSNKADERRVHIYQRAVRDLIAKDIPHEVPPVPRGGIEQFERVLVTLGNRLDHKFAEIRALSEVTERINAGVFLDEVLNHVFEAFEKIVPYDRIGLALIEKNKDGTEIVSAHWARANYEKIFISDQYRAPLNGSSLEKIATTKKPRILNDLNRYLRDNPDSKSTVLIVKEGIQSSLTCPLVIDDSTTGFIFFSSLRKNTYRQAHVELFLQIAGELAITIEKGRAYQEIYVRNQFIRKIFGQYVADEIAEIILNDEGALTLGGQRCLVTILICDLRRFTPMSEQLSPEIVVEALNTFLGAMTSVIMKYGGTVNNLIGDSILAVFGIPVRKSDDVERAVACAIEMQNTMSWVNTTNLENGCPKLAMGVGLNTGEVVVGNIGSEVRKQYSVIGGPVNLASRIESFTSDGQILASETTVNSVKGIISTVGNLKVKVDGIDHPVPIYDVNGIAGDFKIYLK